MAGVTWLFLLLAIRIKAKRRDLIVMLNRDIYLKDPSLTKLENDGVVNVNNENTAVLRYELETFVCEGQYANGMERILDSFLRNIGKNQQPAAWISGFFGSGKSHLAKMIAALWIDREFADKATARNIVNLPDSIKTQLIELSTAGKQNGGLHAATGTLNSGVSSSVRLSLLGIVFKSIGLPEDYQCARFVMYLKKEGIYENVKKEVETDKNIWEEELSHFRISSPIQEALLKYKNDIFFSPKE
jgi:ABC-type lipoprotein export system ATPase subunit